VIGVRGLHDFRESEIERSGAVHPRVFGARQILKYRANDILQLTKTADVVLKLSVGFNESLR